VLDVNKIKSQFPRPDRSDVELVDDCIQVCVRQQSEIAGHSKPSIQDRMVKGDAWLGAVVFVWAAVPSRVRQLQPYQQILLGSGRNPMFFDQFIS
jgi:hypothetical protein